MILHNNICMLNFQFCVYSYFFFKFKLAIIVKAINSHLGTCIVYYITQSKIKEKNKEKNALII